MNEWREKMISRIILEREKYFSVFGSVCKSYVCCRKPNCRCAKGQKHGPYYYLCWRDADGKSRRTYLGGYEEGIWATALLQVIRREKWNGYPHYWLYRRAIKRGLIWNNAVFRFQKFPTKRNVEHLEKVDKEMEGLLAEQVKLE